MSEAELYRALGALTRQRDRWRESIPRVAALLGHDSVKIQAKVLWLLGEMGLAHPDSIAGAVSAVAAFRDAGSISGWAYESVERMRQTGILNGDTNGNFNPLNGATRAEAATVFMRLDATIRIL